MSAVPDPPPVEVKERLQRFDMLLQHLHRLRANLAVDNNVPMALRELHKLQALQMLQHQRHHPHHRRPNKHFHGGVLPILPPLPPLLSPPLPDHRRLPYMQPPGFSPQPSKHHQHHQQEQQQQHLIDGHLVKQKCEWDDPSYNGDMSTEKQISSEEMDLDVAMAVTSNDVSSSHDVTNSDVVTPHDDSPVIVESDEELEDDENVQDLLAEEILAESKEVQEETEHLASSDNGDELNNLPFLPPMMNIELIKVKQIKTKF
jgi:hypothetical protein